jgi:alpha-beta hydrolase superfamily lysophospholipase
MEQKKIGSFDGTTLFSMHVGAEKPCESENFGADPVIFWVHGAFEHADRYLRAAKHFAGLGFHSILFDLRGHGRSGGGKMVLGDFTEYLRDVNAVVQYWREKFSGKAVLLGHSMGGLVAIRHLQVFPNVIANLKCTIVSSPFLGVKVKLPKWKTTLSKAASALYPKLAVPTDLDAKLISHDPTVVRAYETDPLIRRKTTAGWFEQMLRNHALAFAEVAKITGEIHFLVAGDDGLVDAQKAAELYEKISPLAVKSIRVYDGYYHEILNETEDRRAVVLQDLEKILR